MENRRTIKWAVGWTGAYFLVLLLAAAVDVLLWNKLLKPSGEWINIGFTAFLSLLFFWIIYTKTGWSPNTNKKVAFSNLFICILVSAAAAMALFLMLDCGIDRVWEALFPVSEDAYKEMVAALGEFPVISAVRVVLLAPIVEETLMRGFVLGELQGTVGSGRALLVSAVLFSVLHFNMVQTLSAFVAGLVLGILFLKTKSLLCAIFTHSFYNLLSFVVLLGEQGTV